MRKIGLALSGGGFRATLYHLGLVRFLRDAGILRDVTHITSVSGGSILAAHLVLNWDRYNGSPEEFDEVAKELVDFARLDVRNRIVRRYPFVGIRYILRWVTRRPYNRRLTRTGLLEYYYEKYLYGDTCLYQLPAQPELHLLATNLSEGCLCSFTRSGLIMQQRLPGDRIQFERIEAGLTTIPLAVTASSAFPGFFPPILVRSSDIGATEAAFSVQTFTDGGVFDNLGIRAFRFIERCWSEECRPTNADGREVEVEKMEGESAVPRDGDRPREVAYATARNLPAVAERVGGGEATGRELARRDEFERFGDHPTRGFGDPDDEDEEDVEGENDDARAFRGGFVPKVPPPHSATAAGFDAVIASDAGAKLMVHRDSFVGGMINTAMRASDILMDRVWQLEKEIFGSTDGFLFAPIHRAVSPEEDPHAPTTVVQRQVVGIRTDLDRFSPAEIRSLVRHGYCVARQSCRSRPDLFGDRLPDGEPWDPLPPPSPHSAPRRVGGPQSPPDESTLLARELQNSAFRRIWSTMIDWRDGMTYLFVPVMLALVLVVPYLVYWTYVGSRSSRQALQAIAQTDQDEGKLIELLRDGPMPSLEGMPHRDVDRLVPPDYRGFSFLRDGHIVDLRRWSDDPSLWQSIRGTGAYQYRHFQVRKLSAPGADQHLRFQFDTKSADSELRCPNDRLRPVLKRLRVAAPDGAGETPSYRWELDLDFSKVAVGESVDVIVDHMFRGTRNGQLTGERMLPHSVFGDTKVATMWVIHPRRAPSGQLQIFAYKRGRPETKQPVRPTREFAALGGMVRGWQIIDPEPETTFECHWVSGTGL